MAKFGAALLRFAGILLLASGLSGCYGSKTALVDKTNAKYPFDKIIFKRQNDSSNEIFSLKRDGDYYYSTVNGSSENIQIKRMLLYGIATSTYLVQAEFTDTEEILYGFAKVSGNTIAVHTQCGLIGTENILRLKLNDHGPVSGVGFGCEVQNLDPLLSLGRSPDLWVVEETYQIISIE
jgi:hypothetical protein